MSTSDRVVALESAAAAALIAGIVALASPHDVWMPQLGLHPAWLPVILLAARYGPRGLFTGLAFSWGAMIALSVALGGDLGGFEHRLHGASELLALLTATLVAWIGMLHESRMLRATGRLAEATEQQRQAESTVHTLHEGLRYLRARHDRLDCSLSVWRSLASRIEHGDEAAAAEAMLELCEIRTGAKAGRVQLRDGNRLTTLAWRDEWSATPSRPSDIVADATVRAALQSRRITEAAAGATDADSDVACPVLDQRSGAVIGIIALRGVSAGALRVADLRDIAVIAEWLSPTLARSLQAAAQRRKGSEQRKLTGERVL